MNIVTGDAFLETPIGIRYREVNINTGKPMGDVMVKGGNKKTGSKIKGAYFTDPNGEESSFYMPCPSVCRFQILRGG